MLDGMRKASQGWIGRTLMAIVMGVISLSFVVWGVGDIFRGFGGNVVAKVGKTEIPVEALRTAYQTQLQELQRQARRAVTNDQAREMGLDSRVLSKLVADAALDDRTRQLGLAMSDADIARTVLTDQNFAGADGKFDAGKFSEILRDNGFTERTFAQQQRQVYLRQQLVDALAGNLNVPAAALDAVHRYRTETRSVDYFTLAASAAGDVAAPDEPVLQAWYDARKQTFRAPEYRGIVTLAISPASLATPATVSDADASTRYEAEAAKRYGSPERRQISQAVFPDEKSAAEANAKIKTGATLEAAAEEFKSSVVSLGDVAKGEVFDKAVAEQAFAQPANVISDPVKGQFGYVIVHTGAVTLASVKPLAEVADAIKLEIATERAKKTIQGLRDKIEDERTSGKPLAEAAKVAGVTPITIDAIDQSGQDRNGKEIEILTERDALLRAVFASDIGVDNDTLPTRDGGYVWYEVTNVEKARERTLGEVREKVAAAWRDDEIEKRLIAKAADLVKKIDAGEAIEAVAKGESAEVKNIGDVKRGGGGALPAGVVARVFSTLVGKAGAAAGEPQTRIVFKVLDSVTPVLDADDEANKAVEGQLRTSFGEDILLQYIARLQTDIGVTINQSAARLATGGAAEQN